MSLPYAWWQCKKTSSQQELVRQFPKAASSKRSCNVNTFGQGVPPGGSDPELSSSQFSPYSMTTKSISSFLIMTFLSDALQLSTSPFISLHPSLAAENYCQTGTPLLFRRIMWPGLPTSSLLGHPSLLFTDRKDRGVWPSWPLLKIMLSQLQLFLSTSAGGRK